MKTGDVIRHRPSGEEWLVAFVESGRLFACGWPCSSVPVEDCELIEACPQDKHDALVRRLARIKGSDPRGIWARNHLKSTHGG